MTRERFPAGDRLAELLRAHATATLTADERAELEAVRRTDPECAAAVARVDAVHRAFARERALRARIAAPPDPAEEADEAFARMAAAAARAEAELRSRLLHRALPRVVVRRGRTWRRAAAIALLAAAGVLVAAWFGAFSSAPPTLRRSVPAPETAGGEGASIVIAPRLSAVDRTLSWGPLWHAATYDVVILDGAGNVVLRRAADRERSTRWELTADEFERVRAHAPGLRLRVRALDGAGLPVGTSGDLPLTIE